jgi:hypothetical protein
MTADDVDRTLGFAVRATDTTGTTTAYADLVGPVAPAGAALVSTGQPVVSGTAGEGQPLHVSSGRWSRTPETLSYRWHRCNANGRRCTPIPGAAASTYVPTGGDAGRRLLVVVRATVAGASREALSATTAPVAPVPGPALAAEPRVEGAARVGRRLRGAPGQWAGSGSVVLAYRWLRCDATGGGCRSIRGATATTYAQSIRDLGRTLAFVVRATDATGTTTASADLVGPVSPAGAAVASTARPVISGTPEPGRTLQVSSGNWSRAAAGLTYRWQRCDTAGRSCEAIPGATAPAYTVTPADEGHRLVAVVRAAAGGASAEAWSTSALVRPSAGPA